MASVTYLVCDHCGIDASKSGVGPGNITSLEIKLHSAQHQIEKICDLCVDCELELNKAIIRWTEPKRG